MEGERQIQNGYERLRSFQTKLQSPGSSYDFKELPSRWKHCTSAEEDTTVSPYAPQNLIYPIGQTQNTVYRCLTKKEQEAGLKIAKAYKAYALRQTINLRVTNRDEILETKQLMRDTILNSIVKATEAIERFEAGSTDDFRFSSDSAESSGLRTTN